MQLPDGTIIPSYMGVQPRGAAAGGNPSLQDFVLRVGEVKKIVYPTDPQSYSKKFVEYELDVSYRDGGGSYTTSVYRGVQANNWFGGIADQFWSTYRQDPNRDTYSSSGIGQGSLVYILCVGGSQQFGIIMGGARNPDDTPDKKSDGHHLFFEFNGIKAQVKDDGELEIVFRGKTDIDGTLNKDAVATAEGSRLQINKEGNILLATPNDAQFIRINQKDRKLQILADDEWNVQINNQTNITSQSHITVTTHATATHNADGNIFLKSAGVHVGAATDAWMLGTTYRNGESSLNAQLKGCLQTLASMSDQVSRAFAKGIPQMAVVGTLPDGVAEVAKGLAIWTQMGSMFSQMATAIDTFESASATYISKVNLTD